jgi:hypothetical protein
MRSDFTEEQARERRQYERTSIPPSIMGRGMVKCSKNELTYNLGGSGKDTSRSTM